MNHDQKKPDDVCCPPFDPALWDKKSHNWQDKLFIKETIRTFMHMPFPPSIGKMMGRMWDMAKAVGADPDMKDFIILAYDPSPWKSEFYMAVTKEVPEAENVKMTGQFLTRVFDGPYSGVPKWIKEMEKYVVEQGKKTKKYYFYFTTCPKCAKKYGHNYCVAFAEVE